MTPLMLVFFGLIAAGLSAWAFRDATTNNKPAYTAVYASTSMVIWFVLAYSSLAVRVDWHEAAEEPVIEAFVPAAILALLGGVLMAVLTAKAIMEALHDE